MNEGTSPWDCPFVGPDMEGKRDDSGESQILLDNEPLLQFFGYAQLAEHLQNVSKPFGVLARTVVMELPRCSERTVCLRKLLEAKDCAVRAATYKP